MQCKIVVDTCSSISIVCPGVLKQAGIDVAPTTGRLSTVTGETAPLQGRNTVPLTIGTYQTPHTVWVADIADECIIGMDFLPAHGCQVNLKEGVLQIGEEAVPLSTPQVLEPSCYCCCAESSVTLPPKSETLVPARVEGEWKLDSKWALLQPEKTVFSQTSVTVGKTLVDLQGEQVPVRLLNLSEKPKKIKKGLHLVPVNLSSVSCEEIKPKIM